MNVDVMDARKYGGSVQVDHSALIVHVLFVCRGSHQLNLPVLHHDGLAGRLVPILARHCVNRSVNVDGIFDGIVSLR